MAKDVFISHSSLDRELATTVCSALEASAIACWIAPRDIVPGQSWGGSIVKALDECPVMVLVLTERANGSRHVIKEVERADSKAARILTFRIEPVVLNPSLEYFLSAEHWLGQLKRGAARRYKSAVELALMHAIKSALDPDGRMNPGKLL